MSHPQAPEESTTPHEREYMPGADGWSGTICKGCGKKVESSVAPCPECGGEDFRDVPDPRNHIDQGRFLLKVLAGIAIVGIALGLVWLRVSPWGGLFNLIAALGLLAWSKKHPEPAFATAAILFSLVTLGKLLDVLGGHLIGTFSLLLHGSISILLYQAWRAARDARRLGFTPGMLE